MKYFNELKKGDVIFYYDHCKMRPRKVVSCTESNKEIRYEGWNGYTVRYEKELTIVCDRGKPLNIYCGYNNGHFDKCYCNSSKYFSCKESAQISLNMLIDNSKRKVRRLTNMLNKYNNVLNKYEILTTNT